MCGHEARGMSQMKVRSFFETPDDRVISSLQQIAEKEKIEEFVSKRKNDQLIKALGNPEHSERVRGVSSRTSWKEGFPHDDKKRDGYKAVLWKT